MKDTLESGLAIVDKIKVSGYGYHMPLNAREDLYLSNHQLEAVLHQYLVGKHLPMPQKTRSKLAKGLICEALGYTVPKSFKHTKPRFIGQNFDLYVQKETNLQIWNDDISPSRRYVILIPDENDIARFVHVLSGEALAPFDSSGTLTKKYQASALIEPSSSVLVGESDTPALQRLVASEDYFLGNTHRFSDVLPIAEVYKKVKALEGKTFNNPGHGQDRKRAMILHEMVQVALGGERYSDTGQFPDIVEQLVEVKLQTARTVDLGLVSPDNTDNVAAVPQIRHCDARYVVAYGSIQGFTVTINHLIVATGADFFKFFRKFQGKEVNGKLQLHLPRSFFSQQPPEAL